MTERITVTPIHARHSALWVPLTASIAISACGTLGTQDGAPGRALNAADIRDAVPRPEPPSKHGNPRSYVVAGKRYYVLNSARGYVRQGTASWYGTKFHGRRTSSGEIYDMYAMSAAHTTLPLPTYVLVTNLHNQKSAIVKVNDRGPFHGDRLIDLSYAAAVKLGITGNGTAPVEVKAIDVESAPEAAQLLPVNAAAPGHFVQVGAFTDRVNAERLQEHISLHIPFPVTISKSGSSNTISNTISNNSDTLYRVRIGPISDRQQVQTTESRLSDLGIRDVLILSDEALTH